MSAGAAPEPFPWAEAMALGLGLLRWSPRVFWQATPRELIAALDGWRGRPGAEPARHADLQRLMARFPDG